MKFLHCADIHLGSRLSSLPAGNIRDAIRSSVINSFYQMVSYANANDIKVIVMSGDVFDREFPTKKDKQFFYRTIEKNEDITFLYLRGNHDNNESYTEELPNLITFSDSWKSVELEDVTFTGIELNEGNSLSLYSSLRLESKNKNVVILHGDILTQCKDFIDVGNLANKNIDYLALGHIHSFLEKRIDKRGVAIYPGALCGRGFDECNQKGFVEVDITSNDLMYKFIPIRNRLFKEVEIDVTGLKDTYDLINLIDRTIKNDEVNNLWKITLKGKSDFSTINIESDINENLKGKIFYTKVVNKTIKNIKLEHYEKDLSLRGEFIRLVKSKTEFTDEYKDKLLTVGLEFLDVEDLTK